MKKILVLLAMVPVLAIGQTSVSYNRVEAKDTLKLHGVTVGDISLDNTFASASDHKLASQKAIYDFLSVANALKLNIADTAGMLNNYGTGIILGMPSALFAASSYSFTLGGKTFTSTTTLATQSAFTVFARASGSGTPTFQSIDTTFIASFYSKVRSLITAGTGITFVNGIVTSTITQYTDALARASVSLTVTGSSGAATYNNSTGVLNVPTYTLAGLGGISLTSLSSTATGLTYTNTTGVFSLTSGYVIPTTTEETNWNTAYSQTRQWDGGSTGLVAATGRTSLGATTVGGNVFTLTNPSAITFIRVNADNTVSALDAATFRTAIGAGTGSGTVTSAAITLPTGLSVSGSPITSSGTFAITFTSGYSIPTTSSQTNWDAAYTNRITSLTVTGSSGAATISSNTLNIPTYTFNGLSPMTTAGDIIYGGASGAGTRLAAGTSSQLLHGGTTPSWGAVVSGDITSIVWSKITSTPTTISGYGISDAVAVGSSYYIGTTSNAFNRASAAQTLNGINIDGNSASATLINVTTDNTSNSSYSLVWASTNSGNTNANVSPSRLTVNPSTGNLTASLFTGALAGNATTATTLQVARAINGVNFDGSVAITITAAAGTLTGGTLASGVTASSLTSAAGGAFGTNAYNSTVFLPLTAGSGQKLTGDLYINKGSSSLVFQGNTTDAIVFNTGSLLKLADNASGTLGISINLTTGALNQLGSGGFTWNGAVNGGAASFTTGTFSGAISAIGQNSFQAGVSGLAVPLATYGLTTSYPNFTINTFNATSGAAYIGWNIQSATNASDASKYILSNYATKITGDNGSFHFFIAASGTAGNTVSFIDVFNTSQAGVSTFNKTSAGDVVLFTNNAGGAKVAYVYTGTDIVGFGNSANVTTNYDGVVFTYSTHSAAIITNNVTALTVASNQKITTKTDFTVGDNSGSTQFYVTRASSSGYAQQNFTTNGSNTWAQGIGVNAVTSDYEVYNFGLATTVIRLSNSSGNATFSAAVIASSFVKTGSSDSYVLLGGGGTALLSSVGGSGTSYTPTLTNTLNVASSSLINSNFIYSQSGNVVTVTVSINVTATTLATLTNISFTLPVTTSLTTQNYMGSGVAWSGATSSPGTFTISSGTTGVFSFYPSASVSSVSGTFQYIL